RGFDFEGGDDLVDLGFDAEDGDVVLRAAMLDDGGMRVGLRPVEPDDELRADLELLRQQVRRRDEDAVTDVERGTAGDELPRLRVGKGDDADRLLIRDD